MKKGFFSFYALILLYCFLCSLIRFCCSDVRGPHDMGTEVPPAKPVYISDKYYCCTTELYEYDFNTMTCDVFWKEVSCCRPGSRINTHDEGCPCAGAGICKPSGFYKEILIAAHGPFDTLEECAEWRASQ